MNRRALALAVALAVVYGGLSLPPRPTTARADEKAIGAEEKLAARHLGRDRYALVVGIDDYEDARIPDLTVCEEDARAVHALLTNPVVGAVAEKNAVLLTGPNATSRRVRRALSAYRKLPKDATLFVYFSGHGAREGGDTFWVTQDAALGDLFGTAVSEMYLKDALRRVPAERVIVMNDCCHAAGLASAEKALGDMIPILERFRGKGRAILSAAGAFEEAREDRTLGRSVFTFVLVEGLAGKGDLNEDGIVTLSELADYLDREVSDRARLIGGLQRPHVDFEGVQEPSKFWLTVDAERLQRREREEKDRTERLARRLKALENLYFASTIPKQAYELGVKLLPAEERGLDERERRQRAMLVRIADGEFDSPATLKRALDLVLEGAVDEGAAWAAALRRAQSSAKSHQWAHAALAWTAARMQGLSQAGTPAELRDDVMTWLMQPASSGPRLRTSGSGLADDDPRGVFDWIVEGGRVSFVSIRALRDGGRWVTEKESSEFVRVARKLLLREPGWEGLTVTIAYVGDEARASKKTDPVEVIKAQRSNVITVPANQYEQWHLCRSARNVYLLALLQRGLSEHELTPADLPAVHEAAAQIRRTQVRSEEEAECLRRATLLYERACVVADQASLSSARHDLLRSLTACYEDFIARGAR